MKDINEAINAVKELNALIKALETQRNDAIDAILKDFNLSYAELLEIWGS